MLNPDITKTGIKFRAIFKKRIMEFYDTMTGFDIIAFDEWLATPDGKSTKEYLVEKYSVEASNLVEYILTTKSGALL